MYVTTGEMIGLFFGFISSGFFSGSEAVLMSIDVNRAKQLIEHGDKKSSALRFMVEHPSELLTTILIGNNIANIFMASLMTVLTERYFQSDSIGAAVGITTFLILVFGEIIPKTFARTHSEKFAGVTIRILQTVYYLIFPVVKTTTYLINKILGENAVLRGRIVTKNDIEYMVNRAEKEKTMDSKQLELLNSILEFPTIKVKDIMIPRSKISWIPVEYSFEEVITFIGQDSFSRYPVCKGELENTVGFLHVKDLAKVVRDNVQSFNLDELIKESFFVYEHMKIQSVFEHMKNKKIHLSLVKDENGLVVGIVTLEDIIEEILGEIHDEHDAEDESLESEIVQEQLEDEGILVEGTISLRDLYNEFDIKIPLNDNYSTLAGFVLDMLGNNFPEEGQIIVWEGLSFDLKNVEEYEIKNILIKDVDGEKHLFSKRDDNDIVESPA